MSRYDYLLSQDLVSKFHNSGEEPTFVALIMAAMRKADTLNLMKLQHEWPEIWEELKTRYWSPGGFLPEEIPDRIEREPKKDPDDPDRKYNEDEYDR